VRGPQLSPSSRRRRTRIGAALGFALYGVAPALLAQPQAESAASPARLDSPAPAGSPAPAPSSTAPVSPPAGDFPKGATKPPSEKIPKISFLDALRRARTASPLLIAAEEGLGIAEAQVKRSRASWLPSVSGVGTYTRLDADRVVGDRVAAPANALNLSAQVQVPLIAAARWAETARDGDLRRVAELRNVEARRMALKGATAAYLRVVLEKQNVEIAERAVAVSAQQLTFTQIRDQEGVGSRLEVTRAQHELMTNRAYLATRRATLYEAQEALGVLLGQEGPLDVDGTLPPSELPSVGAALASARSREDLSALRLQASSDEKRVEQSYLDYLPTLSASAQAFYQNPPSITFPETGWQFQVILTAPLYDGGRRYADADERRARATRSRADVSYAERVAVSEVRALGRRVEELLEAFRETEGSRKVANETLDLSRRAFEEGSGTQLELIEAERGLRDAETSAAIAEAALLEARVLFRLAAGEVDFGISPSGAPSRPSPSR
jgi:outer membrane protein